MRQHTFLNPRAISSYTFRVHARDAYKRHVESMRFALCALVLLLVVSMSLASLEHEVEKEVGSLRKLFLAELDMKDVPDMELVNTNEEEIQRMTQKYLRNVKTSEEEFLASYDTDLAEFERELDGIPSVMSSKMATECRGKCCKRPLNISFADIGWNWVVQPKEFEAFYCKGRCDDSKSYFASTHAIMQNILKTKGYKVSRPCCAPKKFKSLDVLHYDDNKPPELKVSTIKGMIVKECACT